MEERKGCEKIGEIEDKDILVCEKSDWRKVMENWWELKGTKSKYKKITANDFEDSGYNSLDDDELELEIIGKNKEDNDSMIINKKDLLRTLNSLI